VGGSSGEPDLSLVRVVLFDVDGVLTDGRILWAADQNTVRGFHSRDGVGIKILKRAGLVPGIISGGYSHATVHRAKELGIDHVAQGVENKTRKYLEMRDAIGFADAEACFIGDDLTDLGPMGRVAFPVAVADAPIEVKRRARLVTEHAGGRGAVREVVEVLLRARGAWDEIVRQYEAGER